MKDILSKDDNKQESIEMRESVRGKLTYYQELIYQNKQKKKEEGALEI